MKTKGLLPSPIYTIIIGISILATAYAIILAINIEAENHKLRIELNIKTTLEAMKEVSNCYPNEINVNWTSMDDLSFIVEYIYYNKYMNTYHIGPTIIYSNISPNFVITSTAIYATDNKGDPIILYLTNKYANEDQL